MRAMEQQFLGDPKMLDEARLPRPELASRTTKGRRAQEIGTLGTDEDQSPTDGECDSGHTSTKLVLAIG